MVSRPVVSSIEQSHASSPEFDRVPIGRIKLSSNSCRKQELQDELWPECKDLSPHISVNPLIPIPWNQNQKGSICLLKRSCHRLCKESRHVNNYYFCCKSSIRRGCTPIQQKYLVGAQSLIWLQSSARSSYWRPVENISHRNENPGRMNGLEADRYCVPSRYRSDSFLPKPNLVGLGMIGHHG
jgi:hypothetical protein